jgi:hypothetical protein
VRRLEFEPLRDSLLAIGGALDLTMYGRPVDLTREPYSTRRTIYGKVDRQDVADVMVNFDFATPDLPTGRRHETTVPQQALFLMNSPLVVEQAKKLVTLPAFEACADDSQRVSFLYDRVYQRPPGPEELQLGLEFVGKASPEPAAVSGAEPVQTVSNDGKPLRPKQFARQQAKRGNENRKRAPLSSWKEYAHALLQANEASFVN